MFGPKQKERERRFGFGITHFFQDILQQTSPAALEDLSKLKEYAEDDAARLEGLEGQGVLVAQRSYEEFIKVYQELKDVEKGRGQEIEKSLPYLLRTSGKLPPIATLRLSRDELIDSFSSLLAKNLSQIIDFGQFELKETENFQIEPFIQNVHQIFGIKPKTS